MLLATVNEATMVPFVSQQLGNMELAMTLASRGNLPGAEPLIAQNFERLFNQGSFKEAAEAAAASPQVRQQPVPDVLRRDCCHPLGKVRRSQTT